MCMPCYAALNTTKSNLFLKPLKQLRTHRTDVHKVRYEQILESRREELEAIERRANAEPVEFAVELQITKQNLTQEKQTADRLQKVVYKLQERIDVLESQPSISSLRDDITKLNLEIKQLKQKLRVEV